MKKNIVLITTLTFAGLLFNINARAQNPAPVQRKPEFITNQSAPAFALKDMDGKIVSLADYKGKVVVLDFWATWCGPCKMSFPGMQLALNKYKDDKDVQFLFVDTRETKDNYKELVGNFLTENQYSFKVIFYEKGDDGVQNKFFKAYKIAGIPTKFVVDRDGVVRFEKLGYMPGLSNEKLSDEIAGMIEKAKKPADNNVVQKTE